MFNSSTQQILCAIAGLGFAVGWLELVVWF